MRNIGLKYLAIVLALASTITVGSRAAVGSIAFTSPGSLSTEPAGFGAVNLGLVFTANTNLSVTALGFFNISSGTDSEQVGLYDSSGDLLASATVTTSNLQVSGYFFQAISPVTLTAGNTYTVDAFVPNDNPWDYGSTAPNQAAGVTYQYHDYLYTSSLAFPTETLNAAGGASGTYYGPNFEYTVASTSAIPEPSTVMIWSLLGGIGLGLGYWRRKRAA